MLTRHHGMRGEPKGPRDRKNLGPTKLDTAERKKNYNETPSVGPTQVDYGTPTTKKGWCFEVHTARQKKTPERGKGAARSWGGNSTNFDVGQGVRESTRQKCQGALKGELGHWHIPKKAPGETTGRPGPFKKISPTEGGTAEKLGTIVRIRSKGLELGGLRLSQVVTAERYHGLVRKRKKKN